MYKIKIYKNGKLFAEYDLDEYMLMDKDGKAFVSTGEDPQAFIMNAVRGAIREPEETDSDVIDRPERKTPTHKDKAALKMIIDRMEKDDH